MKCFDPIQGDLLDMEKVVVAVEIDEIFVVRIASAYSRHGFEERLVHEV